MNERMWHFQGGGSKHTLTPPTYFHGVVTHPTPLPQDLRTPLITVTRSCQSPGIDNGARLCSVCKTMQPAWSWSTGSYWTCIEKTPLVTYLIPNSIQNCRFYAPLFSSPLSTAHLRFSQLQDRYGTTSFRDKSGRHSSTTDQSRQTSILNRRPFCLEQLAPIS